jgi:hypothetical protein
MTGSVGYSGNEIKAQIAKYGNFTEATLDPWIQD